ncbi:MAG: aminotransferase class III-fold pyridoxal phosphate-dependent enzyme [Myxococcota bacterium]|nr:aminotransferase class III-fold pyridoxal phosphate-dependent enzyme [Myxococcota bacterium]
MISEVASSSVAHVRRDVASDDGIPSFIGAGDFVYRGVAPPRMVSARGPFLIDEQGRKYLDAGASNGAAGLGHDVALLHEAVNRLGDFPGAPSFCESSLRLRVASRLQERVAAATGMAGRVAFELGGAQGIELALKVARNANPGVIAVFEGAYHGRSIFTSKLSSAARYRRGFGDWQPAVLRLPFPDCRACRFDDEPSRCSVQCAKYVKQTLASDFAGFAGGEDHAFPSILLIEPVLNVAGMVLPDRRYLDAVVAEFKQRGALVIVDEVFTGLYRTGKDFGFQHYGFTPDIVVLSKALSNGMAPISCVWAAEPLLSPALFPPGSHSVTFANNPLSLAIVDAVLDRYEAIPDLQGRLAALEAALAECVNGIVRDFPAAQSGHVRGGVARIVLATPIAAKLRDRAMSIRANAGPAGVVGIILAATGLAPDVINLHPPLTIAPEEMRLLSDLLRETFRAHHESAA